MRTRDLELTTPDGPMTVHEARPDADADAAVLVVIEAFGLNDHIRDVTQRFAEAGYDAVAPDLYHRSDPPRTAAYDDIERAMALMGDTRDELLRSDLEVTLGHLGDLGHASEAVGVVGFCMGGRVAFLAAAQLPVGAAVGFYGGGIVRPRGHRLPLVSFADQMRAPFLGLYGDQDASIPVDAVEELRTALAVDRLDHEVVRYPDAGHGFHCDDRDAYHAASATDAWARTLAWFDAHLR